MPRESSNGYAPLNCKGHLTDEFKSELNKITMRDKALGLKEGEIFHDIWVAGRRAE
jgi:hypothetical protein